MRRTIPLLLACLFACDNNASKPKAPPAVKKPVPEPVSPVGGIPRLRDHHRSAEEEIEALESAEKPDQKHVRQVLQSIDIGVQACERGIREEAKEMVRNAYAQQRKQQAELIRKKTLVWDEIREIDEMLAAIEKGVGTPPPGFTQSELEDARKDKHAAALKLDEELAALKPKMIEKEKLLAQEEVPPQGETLLTRQLEAFKALRKRAEALQ